MRLSASVTLAALNLLLLAATVLLWLSGSTDWEAPRALPPDSALFAPPALSGNAVTGDVELHERPLFAADRRPPAEPGPVEKAPQPAADPPPDPMDQAVLLGLVGHADHGVVLVALKEDVLRLAVGDRLGDWELLGIDARAARFARPDGQQRALPIDPPDRGLPLSGPDGSGPPKNGAPVVDGRARQRMIRKQREAQRRMQDTRMRNQ